MKKLSILKSNERLRTFRLLGGYTQFDLQKISNVSHSTICMIERGIRRPTEGHKKKLAAALGVEVKAIFLEEEKD